MKHQVTWHRHRHTKASSGCAPAWQGAMSWWWASLKTKYNTHTHRMMTETGCRWARHARGLYSSQFECSRCSLAFWPPAVSRCWCSSPALWFSDFMLPSNEPGLLSPPPTALHRQHKHDINTSLWCNDDGDVTSCSHVCMLPRAGFATCRRLSLRAVT